MNSYLKLTVLCKIEPYIYEGYLTTVKEFLSLADILWLKVKELNKWEFCLFDILDTLQFLC